MAFLQIVDLAPYIKAIGWAHEKYTSAGTSITAHREAMRHLSATIGAALGAVRTNERAAKETQEVPGGLLDAVMRAYGELWQDLSGSRRANDARELLKAALTKEQMAQGIAWANEKNGPVTESDVINAPDMFTAAAGGADAVRQVLSEWGPWDDASEELFKQLRAAITPPPGDRGEG